MTDSSPPKAFISYSWSSPQHEQWVMDLATELVQSGVEVILDKWDLREGGDAIAFMESMVTDDTIKKVLVICDRIYADKADGRAGGVGTETQIISKKVYEKSSQSKYAAVVAERDAEGNAYLPVYLSTRIYIDLSQSDRYAGEFEKLVRWIFDKPLNVKPEIGKAPSYIIDPAATALGTSAAAKRAIDAIRNGKEFARGAIDEYLHLIVENLPRFQVREGDELDDAVLKSIEDFLPARNEYLQVVMTLTQYGSATTNGQLLHRFLESLIRFVDRHDNFRFIVHELFLYTLAILLKAEHLESATYILSQPYFVSGDERGRNSKTVTYEEFRQYVESLERRNRRLNMRRLSLRADLLEQRSKTSGISFESVMQADFICYMRAEVSGNENWYPETLLYVGHHRGPFEVFARASSSAYLIRVLPLLGVKIIGKLTEALEEIRADARSRVPRWEGNTFSPSALVGIDQLGSRP
ncbi:SEFIR domain-containing protein [Variovorax sp. LARHSF232]